MAGVSGAATTAAAPRRTRTRRDTRYGGGRMLAACLRENRYAGENVKDGIGGMRKRRRHHGRDVSSSSSSSVSSSSVSFARAASDFSARHSHVIDANAFTRDDLQSLFTRADEMHAAVSKHGGCELLSGKIMSTLFYEPSTRTRLSFEAAMRRLGGAVISTESAAEFSSAAKGESLQDTIRTVHGYCDVIVLRHSVPGSCAAAAEVSDVPVINAGDGPGQHPTQAMLDTYTIRKELGDIEGKRVALVGDLANGRTARSLASMLALYPGVSFVFVAPDVVKMKDDVKQMLDAKGVPWEEAQDLKQVAADVDVMYMTRIQRERFADNPEDYASAKGKYVVDAGVLDAMRDDAIVMHPLPRLDEIDLCVDRDPRAAYFRQVQNGLYIRMALLTLLIPGGVASP